MTQFPFDHRYWDFAHCAYKNEPVRQHLTSLMNEWNIDIAEHLLFSALYHQGTVYPATFLALPHIVKLIETAPNEAFPTLAFFCGSIALPAQSPPTSGGASLTSDLHWPSVEMKRDAEAVFEDCLPQIATYSAQAYAKDPSHYYAEGLAASLGFLELARFLYHGENGIFFCPDCHHANEWVIIEGRLAAFPGDYALEDWKSGTPLTASSIAKPAELTLEVRTIREMLGPLDPTTEALLTNFGAVFECAHCAWHGSLPND